MTDTPYATFLHGLSSGTIPDYTYGIEGGVSPVSKKYAGTGIYNVKDYGATGDGSTDDTTAILAAITACATASAGILGASPGGTVFFPAGVYVVSASLENTVSGFVRLLGAGKHRSQIVGSVNGFMVNSKLDDGNNWSAVANTSGYITGVEHLYIKNTHDLNANLVGALRFSSAYAGGYVAHCLLEGAVGCDAASNNFCTNFVDVDFTTKYGEVTAGTVGCYASQVSFHGCSFTALDEGIRAFSLGMAVVGCRFEQNATGMILGQNPAGGGRTTSAALIAANSGEKNGVGIYCYDVSESLIAGNTFAGVLGPAYNIVPTTGMVYSGGTVTVTTVSTLASHGWASGTRPIQIDSAFPVGFNTSGFVTGTWTGANTFTYSSADPGAPYISFGTWSLKCESALKVKSLQYSQITGFNAGTNPSEVAAVDLYADGAGTGRGNILAGISAGGDWKAPPTLQKSSYTMMGCDTATNFGMGFASLPGQAGVGEPTALEGMRYYITDANTATLGANVTAGGAPSTHGWVGYNGTDWTLQSK